MEVFQAASFIGWISSYRRMCKENAWESLIGRVEESLLKLCSSKKINASFKKKIRAFWFFMRKESCGCVLLKKNSSCVFSFERGEQGFASSSASFFCSVFVYLDYIRDVEYFRCERNGKCCGNILHLF